MNYKYLPAPIVNPIQQFRNLNQYNQYVSPTQRTSQIQRVQTPNTMRFDYQRLRNTQSMQQYPVPQQISQAKPINTPQKQPTKRPHIKMPGQSQAFQQQPTSTSGCDPAVMVALIKENQEIKAKIQEKEKELQLLEEEIALYEHQQ